jgi:integrase
MPKTKLTQTAVERLKAPDPSGKQVLYWDAELKGFGVLCSGVSNARTYVVQRDLPDGRSRRTTVGAVAEMSLQEAREAAAGLLLEMRRGIDPKAARRASLTLRQTLADYLAKHGRLREKSRDLYGQTVEKHLAPWLERPIAGITAEEVEARHRKIAEEVKAQTGKEGKAAANAAMRTFRVLWNYAAERDPSMGTSPTRALKQSWFAVPRRERLVKADELPKFYAAVRELTNQIHRDYVLLLLFTGLRRREAARLTWDDVDFDAKTLRIPAESAKSGRKLDLPLTDFVHELLVERRAHGEPPFVFPSDAKSGHIEEPKFPLAQVAKACGVQISAHDLRRTFITVAESCDISPLALKALVNHSLGGDVTAGYVQMTVERLREPAQRVCSRLKELCDVEELTGEDVAKLQ